MFFTTGLEGGGTSMVDNPIITARTPNARPPHNSFTLVDILTPKKNNNQTIHRSLLIC